MRNAHPIFWILPLRAGGPKPGLRLRENYYFFFLAGFFAAFFAGFFAAMYILL
jgi:hypothetical protein